MVLTQRGGDVFALPEGKRAFAGGDTERGHAGIIAEPAPNSQLT